MRSQTEKKYIFVDGMMKINPQWQKQQGISPKKDESLAIVSSTLDINDATQAQLEATGKPMRLANATVASMEIVQDEDFQTKFKAPVDGGEILDGISNAFAKYEIPIGLLNKLLALIEYRLNFIIDDSASMASASDAPCKEATPYMSKVLVNHTQYMTRWQEVEDRLHIMMDMLAYIPSNVITIQFLNRHDIINLSHEGKTPEQFGMESHQLVSDLFRKGPNGSTPLYAKLKNIFSSTHMNTMHYLFTDGEPTDASIEMVGKLIIERKNPQMNPLTFMSCTNEDAEWMKDIDEKAPFVAEIDDFASERQEVVSKQGTGFPFNRGFWVLCQLVAAINPDDLDAMDESVPFAKMTLDNLMGRRLTPEEYRYYFDANPYAQNYRYLYSLFSREDTTAKRILANQNPNSQGSKPQGSPYNFMSNMSHNSNNSNHSNPYHYEENKYQGPKNNYY